MDWQGLIDKVSGPASAIWHKELYGVEISRVVYAMLILGVCLLLRHVFTRVVIAKLKAWSLKTETDIDTKVIVALEDPIRMVPIILGIFFAGRYLHLTGLLATFHDRGVRTLLAVAVFWGLMRIADPLSIMLERSRFNPSHSAVEWSRKAFKIVAFSLGAAAVLEVWGVKVAPIIASFGLLGVAIALGAQDLFKNLISGLLIIAEKRFNRGDWILVDGIVEGTVESIGIRSTIVRRFDKAPVYVPNSRLSDSAVTNFSKMTHRRIYWMIGLDPRSTVEQLRIVREGIESFVHTNDDFASPNEVATFVRIDRFGDHSIDLMLYCFTKTTNWGEWLRIKEALAFRIKEIVEDAGTLIAIPTHNVLLGGHGERPEVFVPPSGNGAALSAPSKSLTPA